MRLALAAFRPATLVSLGKHGMLASLQGHWYLSITDPASPAMPGLLQLLVRSLPAHGILGLLREALRQPLAASPLESGLAPFGQASTPLQAARAAPLL